MQRIYWFRASRYPTEGALDQKLLNVYFDEEQIFPF